MSDKYKELSDCLSEIIGQVNEFKKSYNDYIKPLIRANLVLMLKIGKIIGDKVAEDVVALNEDIDLFLNQNDNTDLYKSLIEDAVNLKNELWEL